MSYDLILGRQAKKEIKTLDTSTIKRIEVRFLQISNNPYKTSSKFKLLC